MQLATPRLPTPNHFWSWIDRHSDQDFWSLYNGDFRTTARAAVAHEMDRHADYLIGSHAADASRAERHFGC